MTLREVLTFDVLQQAQPEVLAGGAELDREVRWVHSSEIYEIAPLLSGGELLLTTGLGLVGVDAQARRRYIRDIALRGVAGVAFELNRSFEEVPPEMVEQACRVGLPLIVLRSVVPFIRVSEVVNTVLVDYSSRGLRRLESMGRAINESLIGGAAPETLLAVASSLLGAPLTLHGDDGAVIARQGDLPEVDHVLAEVPVRLPSGVGWLLRVHGYSPLPNDELLAALEHTAIAVAVSVLRAETPTVSRDRRAAMLLVELMDHAPVNESELSLRARLAGLQLTPGERLVGVVMQSISPARETRFIDTAAHLLGLPALRARMGDLTLAAFAVGKAQPDAVGSVLHALREAESRVTVDHLVVGVGHATEGTADLTELGQSLRAARSVVGLLATWPHTRGARVAASREVALELLLGRSTERGELDRLVDSTIGRLASWDQRYHSELIPTLNAYLRNGCSVTRTSRALHIGRQALYQRIERIEQLLGHRVADPELHNALLLASTAHALRGRQQAG